MSSTTPPIDFIEQLVCIDNTSSSWKIRIVDPNTHTLTDCFLGTYLQLPAYLVWSVALGFQFGRAHDMPRRIQHSTLTLLRLIAALLVVQTIVEFVLNYFTDVYPTTRSVDAAFGSQLILLFTRLVVLTLNALVIFNRNVFTRVFPVSLVVTLYAVTLVNLTEFVNRIYGGRASYDQMLTYERIDMLKTFFFNSLLVGYLLTVLTAFKFESIRVFNVPAGSAADLFDSRLTGVSEEDEASYLSYLSLGWLQNTMTKGYRREISSIADLCMLPESLWLGRAFNRFLHRFVKRKKLSSSPHDENDYTSSPIIEPDRLTDPTYLDRFSTRYEEDILFRNRTSATSRQPGLVQNGLVRTMFSSFGREYFLLGLIKFTNDCLNFAAPLMLNQLVQFIELDASASIKSGLTYATLLTASSLVCSILNVHFTHSLNKLSLRVRASLVSLVYRKSCLVQLVALDASFSLGQVLNFMSIDCDAIVNMLPSVHTLWSGPLQIVITLYLLYSQIGVSFVIGVVLVLVLIPVNKVICDFIGRVQTRMMTFKDERVNIMTEFLDGIRVIKFYSWERYFLERIDRVRQRELRELRAKKYLDAGCVYFWATTPILMSVFTFVAYVYLGHTLTPSKVFTSLALFNMLINPLNALPWVINGVAQAWVSVKRVQRYLDLPNLNWLAYYTFNELATSSSLASSSSSSSSSETIVEIKNANFSWKLQSNLPTSSTSFGEEESILAVEAENENNDGQPVLNDISLTIKRGQLVGVIGKVGAGKTSLLHSILAELDKLDDTGRVRIDPGVCAEGFAYVSQDSWIQGGSVRENIVFGSHHYDPVLYSQVISACALDADVALLPHGHDTPVGENGVCLSGGQKARLALARACYARSHKHLYLLDDPLSAVDAHVAQHIFVHCIQGLLADKTRVLCTHHVKFLAQADMVVVLEQGRVREIGRGRDVIEAYLQRESLHIPRRQPDSSDAATTTVSSRTIDKSENAEDETLVSALSADDSSTVPLLTTTARSTTRSPQPGVTTPAVREVLERFHEQQEIKREEEEKERGVISRVVYKFYCKSIGWILCGLVILSLFLMQASKNLTDFWLSYWTEHHGSTNDSTITTRGLQSDAGQTSHAAASHSQGWWWSSQATYVLNPMSNVVNFYSPLALIDPRPQDDSNTRRFFLVYLTLGALNTVFTLARAFLFAYSGIQAGKFIHNKLVDSLSKASLKFFDTTPRGRIINRISSDMYTIDDSLPFILNIFLACVFGVAGVLVVTCYSLPLFFVVLVPLSFIYYSIQSYYRWTSRELRRLTSVSLSPVYNHFHETIKGLVTIRSFRQVSAFLGQHDTHLDNYIRASYSSMSASQWLQYRLQLLSVIMIAFVGFVAVIEHIISISSSSSSAARTSNASLIGLALSYVLNVTGSLNGLIGSFTETEKDMVSVERAHQFIDLPPENWHGRCEVEPSWPARADIEFENVTITYTGSLDSCALRDVSFRIQAGEKVGICGRTGSGKSSLLATLFRAVEIDLGTIRIDGRDIRDLNLKDLREKLSIIPQDAFLFRASLRTNLDPTGTKSDSELWSALRDVHLDLKFRAMRDDDDLNTNTNNESEANNGFGGGCGSGLDWMIEEKGKNLSSGERQLVCLARAILANRSIICIDEATASVDYETDAFIQATIRSKFKNVTVLTVAHRINTLLDYDRVLVMDEGRVAEFDTVSNLLARGSNSLFARLCRQATRTSTTSN